MSTETARGWTLVETFVANHPDEAAQVVEKLPHESAGALVDGAPPSVATLVVSRMSTETATAALTTCAPARAAAILRRLPGARAATLLRSLDAARRSALLDALGSDSAVFRRALDFPPGSAAALMDPRPLALPEDLSVRDARRQVRRHMAPHTDALAVVARDGTFLGCVGLGALVLAESATRLRDIADRNAGWIRPSASRIALLAHPAWATQPILPVVDEAGLLVGTISTATRDQLRGIIVSPAPRPAGALPVGLAVGELYLVTAARLLATLVGAPTSRTQEAP